MFKKGFLWVLFTFLGVGVMTLSLSNYMSLRFETPKIQEQQQLQLAKQLVQEGGFSQNQSVALSNNLYTIRDIAIKNRSSLAHFQFAFSIVCFLLSSFFYLRR